MWKHVIFYSYIVIFLFGNILLLLNIDIISVIHTTGWLPYIHYETYTSTETSSLYILIVLAVINILFLKNNKLSEIFPYVDASTLTISIIYIFVYFLKPYLLLINPTGLAPAYLGCIEIGGIFTNSLYIVLIINSIIIFHIK